MGRGRVLQGAQGAERREQRCWGSSARGWRLARDEGTGEDTGGIDQGVRPMFQKVLEYFSN